ncbi:MAG TPA: M23 family metallopeptidase [Gemmatimonadaceae bacterium]|nr:M23 family metallopeptidase [Gemmatimonadaceae bacterium]
MPAPTSTLRRMSWASPTLALLLAVACVEVRDASDEAAKQAAKQAAAGGSGGAVYVGDAKPNATTPSPDTYGADSATPVRGFGPVPIEVALRADSTRTLEVVDSAPAAMPTEGDLALLQREIIVPVAGITKSALRDTYDEIRGTSRRHEALDIPAPRGAAVLSATPGRVLKLFNSKPGGLMVYATDSTERFILMYAHLDAYQPGLADGQPLRRGQQLGTVGISGNAAPSVPHLHFAVARSSDVKQWWKGVPVNPYPLLR